jgi:hypothetical protein
MQMSEYDRMIATIEIFKRYPEGSNMVADYDGTIYWGPDPREVTEEDIATLKALGWKPESRFRAFYYV